ncbi:MAG: hypothetical protein GF375_01915 [Candidatus Omnitrophica bacterium]|nr:hypothetical protein [Candidatus Omnitrophota bacterium]MBD3268882.1 hypothetical protein [Candidatus Omnitrophota bacterium]
MVKILSFFILTFFLIFSCLADLPEIARHPKARLISEESVTGREKKVYVYRAPLSKEGVVRFYKEMLEYQGWQLQDGGGGIYTFRKKDLSFILSFVYTGVKNTTKYRISLERRSSEDSGSGCESCSN